MIYGYARISRKDKYDPPNLEGRSTIETSFLMDAV